MTILLCLLILGYNKNICKQLIFQETIDTEVKTLLNLKTQYKSVTGSDWKPTVALQSSAPSNSVLNVDELLTKIADQGNKIRILKSEKSSKNIIDAEVKVLLDLKAEYKLATGQEWKPNSGNTQTVKTTITTNTENKLLCDIAAQGDLVRKLKSEKAEKAIVDTEVNILLQLKSEFKTLTGKAWKIEYSPKDKEVAPSMPDIAANESVTELTLKINEQGNKVRQLKCTNGPKVSYLVSNICFINTIFVYSYSNY